MQTTVNKRNTEIYKILLGVLEMLQSSMGEERISFARAVEESLAFRAGRRPRTRAEIRYVCARMMRRVPWLAGTPVVEIGRHECEAVLDRAGTARQQRKWRAILHGVLEYSLQQGWSFHNPVARVRLPALQEREVQPLSWNEIRQLASSARQPQHRCCMPAMGLMLWAGVRPAEVERLHWSDINWEENVITLRPMHSKTGGCRHVQLHAALKAWLREYGRGQGSICPANWQRHWRQLRHAAGLIPWRQDVLRHTFASYHAKHFHDFPRLQEDMGHRSSALLRTRYLSMHGLTRTHARLFWTPGAV